MNGKLFAAIRVKTMLKFFFRFLLVLTLTVLTQIGGLVYLMCQFLLRFFPEGLKNRLWKETVFFITVYLSVGLFAVPPLAKKFGRFPLPLIEANGIKPATPLTWLMNRHYVTETMLKTVNRTSSTFRLENPEYQLIYFDANFPFINGFPLLPHWSHSDGKKVDLAFIYSDPKTGKPTNDVPTHFGYGSFQSAKKGERNMPNECLNKGFIQYSALQYFAWFPNKLEVNEEMTADLIKILCKDESVSKIFIEPHLKTRWKLNGFQKIRFHGCHAVRHDDHIHFQIK